MLRYTSTVCDFLNQEKKRTLLIKGQWGVGKTFFIRHCIQEYLKDNPGRNRPFCYVSLFGLSSMEEVKSAIITAAGLIRGGVNILARMFDGLVNKAFSVSVPSVALNALEDKLLKNCIVCLDDLERKNKALSLDAIFGLTDRLARELSCHVILIIHEGELKEELETLRRYRDKVIDMEIAFDPSLERNLSVVFREDDRFSSIAEVKTALESLERKNIRTIQRIKVMTEDFEFLLSQQSSNVRAQLVRQIAVHCIFHYEFGSILQPDQLVHASWMALEIAERLDKRDSDPFTEQEKPKREDINDTSELIAKSRFVAHDLDPVFLHYLQTGYVDRQRADPIIAVWKENSARLNMRDEVLQLRDSAWAGYGTSQAELLREMVAFLDRNLEKLTTEEYGDHVNFISKLDNSFKREEWDEKFAGHIILRGDMEQLEKLTTLNVSPATSTRLATKRNELLRSFSISDLVTRLCTGDGWSPKDMIYLNAYTKKELFDYFTSSQNPNGCVQLNVLSERLINKYNTCERELAEKFFSIVTEVSSRSELDRRRAEKTLTRLQNLLSSPPYKSDSAGENATDTA